MSKKKKKCPDCADMVMTVSRLAVNNSKLEDEIEHLEETIERRENITTDLISHILSNNLMTIEELGELGVMVRPVPKTNMLESLMEHIAGEFGEPDCDSCDDENCPVTEQPSDPKQIN